MITIAKIQQTEADLDRGQLTFHACLVRDMLDEIRRLAAIVESLQARAIDQELMNKYTR